MEEFLRCEFGITEDKINNLKVDKLFFSRYGGNRVLYCQFTSAKDRAKITAKAEFLQRKEEKPSLTPQIIKYIPQEMFNWQKALTSYTYQLRKNLNNPLATIIRFQHDNFEVRMRLHIDHPNYNKDF